MDATFSKPDVDGNDDLIKHMQQRLKLLRNDTHVYHIIFTRFI